MQTYMIIMLVVFLSFTFVMGCILYHNIREQKEQEKKARLVIQGEVQQTYMKQVKEYKRKKRIYLIEVFKLFEFFTGKLKILGIVSLVGYLITTFLLYLISKHIGLAVILGLNWFLMVFVFTDNKVQKHKKSYLKGLGVAISSIQSGVEAGNHITECFNDLNKRETLDKTILREFQKVNSQVSLGKPLEVALKDFLDKNYFFNETIMFVSVIVFFSEKGGEGLKEILKDLNTSLEEKIVIYDEIDAILGINKLLLNAFIYGYFAFIFLVKVFMNSVYDKLALNYTGYIKVFVGFVLAGLCVYTYKSMIKKVVEGV